MFPAVKRALSPTSLLSGSNNPDDDVESYADTYFREIGFKVGENSLMGSTESPDQDGEEFLEGVDRSLGLLEDNSLSTDVERAVAVASARSERNMYGRQPSPATQPSLPTPSQSKLTMAKAYNAPFHSYFGQLMNDEGRISPRDAFAITYDNRDADDISISTLGEESIKRKPSPTYAQYQQQVNRKKKLTKAAPPRPELDTLDLKKTTTASTLEQRPSEDSADLPRNSKHSRASTRTYEVEAASKRRWRLILFFVCIAVIMLAAASTVLAVTIIQLRESEGSSKDRPEEVPSNTWIPEIRQWTSSPKPSPTTSPAGSHTKSPTVSPTSNPVELAQQDLLQVIATVAPDSLDAISDTSSPQYRAFDWAVNDPEYLNYSIERVIQRWSLSVLFFSLGGDEWTVGRRLEGGEGNATMVDWLSYDNECLWYSADGEHVCDHNSNRLRGVHLSNRGLAGTIPPEIVLLGGTLERLFLASNKITGSLPVEMGGLSNLVGMQLTSNELTGSIPSSIGRLSNLVVLGLGSNRLSGSLPTTLGGLKSLKTLGLEGNSLNGTLPSELGQLTGLEQFSLEANKLDGAIPSELGMLENLQIFSLHQNKLDGEMPLEFCLANGTSTLVLSADCMEVTCECCTLCCYGCAGNSEGILIEATGTPFPPPAPTSSLTVPTQSPTTAPTGLFDQLKPAIADAQKKAKETATGRAGGKNHLPLQGRVATSHWLSMNPSTSPTSKPTECEVIVSVEKSCYERNGGNIDVKFENCGAQAADWIGLFENDYFQSDPAEHDATSFNDSEYWVRACGREECSTPVDSGVVSLGEGRLKVKHGDYRVFFIKEGVTIAKSTAFAVNRRCD